MIEKLEGKPVYDGEYCMSVSDTTKGEIIQKINEIIDLVNKLGGEK